MKGMRVSVRYMAQLRTAAGVAGETVEIDGPCTAADLAARLAARHGEALRRLLLGTDSRLSPIILVFVNDAQVGAGDSGPLQDGDTVTLLSPIAGG
jgi:molybdopterin converting factor small subunit